MKMIAIHTVQAGGDKVYAPGAEFETSEADAKRLIALGAAHQKTKTVVDNSSSTQPPPPPPGEDLDKMTREQLVALAADRKVKIAENADKDAIIAALREAAKPKP